MFASVRGYFREFSREKERVENRTAFLKERKEERAAENLEKWVEKVKVLLQLRLKRSVSFVSLWD